MSGAGGTTFAAAWRSWHEGVDAGRRAPHGPLAVTAMHVLSDAPSRLLGLPGAWWAGASGPVIELDAVADAAERLSLGGTPIEGRHEFGVIPERGGVVLDRGPAPGGSGASRSIEVATRGGRTVVRPRDPDAPLLAAFEATPAFEPDERFVVAGRFELAEAPRAITVDAALPGIQHVYDSPGDVVFELAGREARLVTFDAGGGALFAVFTDATSGVTTFAANRSLVIGAPDAAGAVTLDFNRATNLPFAYTDFATCRLPPDANRLAVAIEAGERTPPRRLRADGELVAQH